MRNVIKILISIFVIVLTIIIAIGYSFKSALKDFKILESGEILNGVYSVYGNIANMFLIKAGEKFIAIDAGDSKHIVESELVKLNINSDDVVAIFLTHSDYDHTAGVDIFKNAEVFLSTDEEQMINGKKRRFFFKKNELSCDYSLLENNQTLKFENVEIKTIATPGHTPGSMSYIINSDLMFVGDALIIKEGDIHDFPMLFTMNRKEMKKSIEKIKQIEGIKVIFTSHSGFLNK